MNRETLVRQGKSRGHTCRTTPDDQCAVIHLHFRGLQWFQLRYAGDRHADQCFSFLSCTIPIIGMHPRTLVANIGHLKQVGIQPRMTQRILE